MASPASTSASISGSKSTSTRVASHAGSWYEEDASTLSSQFDRWVSVSGPLNVDLATTRVRAIIAPHAGYSYSGPTAAYAYKHINTPDIKRVFILGPSHHHYTRICELSAHSLYATPLGALELDRDVIAELSASKQFSTMSRSVDEDEHSIEMQLPFLRYMLQKTAQPSTSSLPKIVPILVGALDVDGEKAFGKLLANYWKDVENFFVISSDFAHWGSRFSFAPRPSDPSIPIHTFISDMDHRGMALIESKDADGLQQYLKKEQNTICGRHPIAVMLRSLLSVPSLPHSIRFVHYAQSSQVKSVHESSVSYASATVTCERKK